MGVELMGKRLFRFRDELDKDGEPVSGRDAAHQKLEQVLASGKHPNAECREDHNSDYPYQVWSGPADPYTREPDPEPDPAAVLAAEDALLDRLAERLAAKLAERG